MTASQYSLLIVGMLLVTYIPRVAPFWVMDRIQIPASVIRFLEFVPYAMLGALIFPGVITSVGGHWVISLTAFSVGVLAAYRWGGTMVPILLSVITATLAQWLIG